ncbi:MAG: thiamine ABC transporter permease [Firmicutes bacterium HGW-Firmicutes-2]|jgi:ATP-binding cassette subfamily B protein|nr:MAG: thiamine ABC transporter permease [Firmicutes bacterium HGW-Firmicutes-2]
MAGQQNYKKFISYYKPHKKLFILDMLSALVIAAIDLVYPMLSRQVLNDYLPTSDETLRPFLIFIGALLLMYVVRSAFQFIVDYWGHILGVRMEYDMRKELFNHLQKLSFKYYDKTRTGHIMSRMINDLNEMTELAHHGPEDLFLSIIMLVGSFIAMLMIQWKLALAVYLFIPVLVWFAIKQRTKMSNGFKEVKKSMAGINADLESSISGIRVAKSFANENYEIDKFDKGNMIFRGSKNIAYKTMAIFMLGMSFMTNSLHVVALGFGGFLIYKGEMSYTDLIAFTLYINNFLIPIRRLTSFVQQYESGMAGFERFMEIMATEPEIMDQENAIELKNIKGDIRFEDVVFSYNNHETVLDGINLEITPGHTLAIVGPSGGGKTTLCHLIPRFYEVDGGRISIDGIDIREVTMASLRTNIGLVSQDIFLFAGTVRENILYGRTGASDTDIIEAAKNAEIHDFIMGLEEGYDTIVGERGLRLSGGQKQRISIARVFLKNPPILILDEATSALDNETELKVQQALEKLSKGRTSLVIAHRLSTIKNADEILVITENGIEEKGNHETLLNNNKLYSKLYHAQFKGYIPDEL